MNPLFFFEAKAPEKWPFTYPQMINLNPKSTNKKELSFPKLLHPNIIKELICIRVSTSLLHQCKCRATDYISKHFEPV
jgi:hypothetical protein